jgi:hypothetical protein
MSTKMNNQSKKLILLSNKKIPFFSIQESGNFFIFRLYYTCAFRAFGGMVMKLIDGGRIISGGLTDGGHMLPDGGRIITGGGGAMSDLVCTV